MIVICVYPSTRDTETDNHWERARHVNTSRTEHHIFLDSETATVYTGTRKIIEIKTRSQTRNFF